MCSTENKTFLSGPLELVGWPWGFLFAVLFPTSTTRGWNCKYRCISFLWLLWDSNSMANRHNNLSIVVEAANSKSVYDRTMCLMDICALLGSTFHVCLLQWMKSMDSLSLRIKWFLCACLVMLEVVVVWCCWTPFSLTGA